MWCLGALCLAQQAQKPKEEAQQQTLPQQEQQPAPELRTQPPQGDPRTQHRGAYAGIDRPHFISGRVILDDGTPPPEPVAIERACGGAVRLEGFTDMQGRFSFYLGQNARAVDASMGLPLDAAGTAVEATTRWPAELGPCGLRATLSGFRSAMVNISGRSAMEGSDVGTIFLRRLGRAEGTTISATSWQAPKNAQKALAKGIEAAQRSNSDEARKQFERATALYPRYAAAWFELGRVHQNLKRPAQARSAYEKAVEVDPKFVKPYVQLAALAAEERNWPETVALSEHALRLDRISFPEAFFLHSLANLNLKKLDDAEESARTVLRMDAEHPNPKAYYLLGTILKERKLYNEAAEQLRRYIEKAPNAKDVEFARKELADIERLAAAGKR